MSYIFKVGIVFIFICSLIDLNKATGQVNDEQELSIGHLRQLPDIQFPELSTQVQLQNCLQEADQKSTTSVRLIEGLAAEFRKSSSEFDQIVTKSASDQSHSRKSLDEKTSIIRNLKRDSLKLNLELDKKFDCTGTSAADVAKCRSFCNYPYSHDYCSKDWSKWKYIIGLIRREGRMFRAEYKSAGRVCVELHVSLAKRL